MGYVYAALWFAIGLILIITMAKENKIFYFAGGFFLILGAWWLLDQLTEIKMFEGAPGMALKIFSGVSLLILGAVFVRQYIRKNKEVQNTQDKES